MKLCQKGSSLVEMALALPTFAALVSGALFLSYYIYSHNILRWHLQETLICTEDLRRPSECIDSLKKQINATLPFGKVGRTKVLLKKNQITGMIDFSITEDISIHEVQILPRPVSRAFL